MIIPIIFCDRDDPYIRYDYMETRLKLDLKHLIIMSVLRCQRWLSFVAEDD